MPKRSSTQKEQDEKKILSELIINSKENIDVIAKRCGFSRQKVYKAIRQMEKDQLILGYTTIFDEEKLGLNHYILLIKKTSKILPEGTAEKIIARRAETLLKNVGGAIESSFYVHGAYDWVVTFTAQDIIQAKKYADLLTALHPGEIEKVFLLQTLVCIKKQYILNPDRTKLKHIL